MLEFASMHIVFLFFKIIKNMYNRDTHIMQLCDHFWKKIGVNMVQIIAMIVAHTEKLHFRLRAST